MSVNKTLTAVQGTAVFHGSVSPVSHWIPPCWTEVISSQTHLVPLEIGPCNGMAEWVGMKCLTVLATLKTVCFPFVGLNHKIVK